MRGGDISNRTAPTILFDLDLILELENSSEKGIDKLMSMFKKKEPTYKVNRVMRDTLLRVWNNYDLQIGLFTFNLDWELEQRRLHEIMFIHYVPYNRVVFCVDDMDLRKERAMYIFSGNEELISTLSDIKAKHISELPEVLR